MQIASILLPGSFGKQVVLHFSYAFIVFLIFSTAVVAENLVEQRWREQNIALSALEQSTAKTAVAQQAIDQIYVELREFSMRLAESDNAYLAVLDRYYDVLAALEEQSKLRVLAKASPIFLIATRNELLNRRDAWMNAGVTGEALQNAHRDYTEAVHAVTEARVERNRSIRDEIDPEIQRLKSLRADIIRELDGLSQVEYDPYLTTKWFNAAQDLFEAEQQQFADTRALDESYTAFMATLGDASPPFLQSVKVTSGDQFFYDFSWIRQGYEDDVAASIEYAQQRDTIADNLPNYTEILKSISLERESAHSDRHFLAIQMRAMSTDLERLGEDHYLLERNQILATMFAEMGIAVTEAVLTGGVATAIRRGEEIAERKLLEATLGNKQIVGDIEEYAAGRVSERLVRAVDDAGRAQFDRLVTTLNTQRAAFVAFEVEETVLRRLRAQDHHFGSLAEASQNMLPETVNKLVREVSSTVETRASRLFPELDFDSFEFERLTRQSLKDEEEILIGRATALAGKSPDLFEAYSAGDQRVLVHNPHTTDVREIFEGQAVEWAISAGIDAGFEAKNLMANPADLSGIRSVGRQAVIGMAFSAVEGLAKTYISQLYEGQIIEIEAKYWTTFMQLAAMQQYYYHLTIEDGELAETEKWYRDAVNKMNAYLSEIGLPRRTGGEIPVAQEISSDIDSVTVELKFSTPLSVVPIVSIGDTKLTVSGEGQNWRANVAITNSLRDTRSVGLTVEIGDVGPSQYDAFDTDPTTIAYFPVRLSNWVGYEKGADTRHILLFEEPNDNNGLLTRFGHLELVAATFPAFVTVNGDKEDLVLRTEGQGNFPLTAKLEAVTCPAEIDCQYQELQIETPNTDGVYVWPGALFCFGSIPDSWRFDFQVFLVDSTGRQTKPRPVTPTCRN